MAFAPQQPDVATVVVPQSRTEREVAILILVTTFTVGLAGRVWLCGHDDGIYWPDEIYQSLEPAHRLVFGYGLLPWEFVEGTRNWAFPGFIAGVLKLAALAGLDSPRQYLTSVRLVFCAISLGTVLGSYKLARVCEASPVAAACGAAIFALVAPAVYFAPRALSENASALPAVWGFALALPQRSSRRQVFIGACLLGVATLLRLQNGVFCIGLLAILASRRRWDCLGAAAGGIALWVFLYGLIDRLTWGGWFHSAIAYLRFNLVNGGASAWGTAPFSFYVASLWTSMGWAAVVMGALALLAVRRAPGLFAVALTFLLLHSYEPHKELRFILPVLPLFCALAGAGIDVLARFSSPPVSRACAAGLIVLSLFSFSHFHDLTFRQIGQQSGISLPDASAYDAQGSVNRLLLVAHGEPDLRGLEIQGTGLALTGGYSYLHRRVPIYQDSSPPTDDHFFNYMIVPRYSETQGENMATDGDLMLLRLHRSYYRTDDGYNWRLP